MTKIEQLARKWILEDSPSAGGNCATLQYYWDEGEDEDAETIIAEWVQEYIAHVQHFLTEVSK